MVLLRLNLVNFIRVCCHLSVITFVSSSNLRKLQAFAEVLTNATSAGKRTNDAQKTFKKVVVPSVYREWVGSKPDWVTSEAIRNQYGYEVFLYQKLDSALPNFIANNRGTEGGVYLRYIVDHYDDFPDVAIFVHAQCVNYIIDYIKLESYSS